ncbi:hypothetical protein E3O21_09400 [Cryobacterium flavum]|uniref:Uncharacterized protein n=2 Tax=Cryobacterium flavum TaxID=1424659 RepID=A0ABY2I5F5_9MICO|nr:MULTISPECIES: hypothetical protein [Cryobacterium]TFB77839.1 hypothetical protein E3O21_09400 [Cryobacterium flavum]
MPESVSPQPAAISAPRVRCAYRLVLPPGWVLIPVGDSADAAITNLVDRQFAGLPTDTYGPQKKRLGAGLRTIAAEARRAGGLDLVFPLAMPWLVPVSAGIVMSEVRTDAPSDTAVALLAERMQPSGPNATVARTRAGRCVREIVDLPRAPDGNGRLTVAAVRTVHYSWPVPGAPGSFLVSALTVSGAPIAEFEPIVEALTELFDVMMESVVWA